MEDREIKRRIISAISKIFLVLGSILLGIIWIYAMNFYWSPNHVATSRGDYIGAIYNIVQDILEMSKYEPLGGVLAMLSVSLLAVGILLYAVSRHLK